MRSLVLALAFAAPLSALAAPYTFTKPNIHDRAMKEQSVSLTFVNLTSQDREVRIGDTIYKIRELKTLHVSAPVGSSVHVYSETNSKINGQELMQVSVEDQNRSITLK